MVQDRSPAGSPAAEPGAGHSADTNADTGGVGQPKKDGVPAKGGKTKEVGGRDGPDPTRFGDWENKGRCIDF